MKKNIMIFSLLLIIVIVILGSLINLKEPSLEERREGVLDELGLAIEEAEAKGVYKCCIHPGCTMCYLSGNKWNYGEGGKCYCDDFIARGEDPCPQCIKGLEEGLCESSIEEECDPESEENFKSID